MRRKEIFHVYIGYFNGLILCCLVKIWKIDRTGILLCDCIDLQRLSTTHVITVEMYSKCNVMNQLIMWDETEIMLIFTETSGSKTNG